MSDGTIRDILVNVLSDGVSAVFGWVIGKGLKTVRETVLEQLDEPHIASLFADAVQGLAEVCSFGDPTMKAFLASPEVITAVTQLFASGVTKTDHANHTKAIKESFSVALALHKDLPVDQVKQQAELIFGHLVNVCEATLSAHVEAGGQGLAAHESLSAGRHKMVQGLLETIAVRQEYLIECFSKGHWDLQQLLTFEQEYRHAVSEETAFITPPSDKQQPVPIDKLYVYPDFVKRSRWEGENHLPVSHLLNSAYRSVILGDPGAGKSTFARKLCHDLSTGKTSELFGGRQLTPVLVTLRHYGERKKSHNWSIVDFIERCAHADYQIPVPEGALTYLLNSNRLLVVFDGLDELVDTSDRQRISLDVQHFCNKFPGIPVIITSRVVGYDQAPLNPQVFDTYLLAPFKQTQVQTYVHKWFTNGAGLSADEGEKRAHSFYAESDRVADLRSNPLMLALMCYLYLGDNYIPEHRPGLYKKCATWLFRQWDSSRRIPVPPSFEEHLEGTIQRIAYWIYSEPDYQQGITEDTLVEKTSEFLLETSFEERNESRVAARHLIEYCCKGRAWVFSDTGTTADGEPLYEFTHRTFLEYFTAEHLVQEYYTPEALWSVLAPKVARKEWDMVAQLAFQEFSRTRSATAKELLFDHLHTAAADTPYPSRWNILLFGARCLEFVNLKPSTTRLLAETCLDEYFDWHRTLVENARIAGESWPSTMPEVQPSVNLCSPLLRSSRQNAPYVADTLRTWFQSKIVESDGISAPLASEMLVRAIGLNWPLTRGGQGFWDGFCNDLLESCRETIVELAKVFSFPCHIAFAQGWIELEYAVHWHGPEWLFCDCRTVFSEEGVTHRTCPVRLALHVLQEGEPETPWMDFAQLIANLAPFLTALPTPWPEVKSVPVGHSESSRELELLDSPDGMFGAFCLLALASEQLPNQWSVSLKVAQPAASHLQVLLRTRQDSVMGARVLVAIAALGVTAPQGDFIQRWVSKQISLSSSGGRQRSRRNKVSKRR